MVKISGSKSLWFDKCDVVASILFVFLLHMFLVSWYARSNFRILARIASYSSNSAVSPRPDTWTSWLGQSSCIQCFRICKRKAQLLLLACWFSCFLTWRCCHPQTTYIPLSLSSNLNRSSFSLSNYGHNFYNSIIMYRRRHLPYETDNDINIARFYKLKYTNFISFFSFCSFFIKNCYYINAVVVHNLDSCY